MDILLDEIEKALNEEMYLVALQATLALPDICGALEAEDGKATMKMQRTAILSQSNP